MSATNSAPSSNPLLAVSPAAAPSLLIQAARESAQADGVLPSTANNAVLQQARLSLQQQRLSNHLQASNKKKKGPPLRRGKWTPEEEAYAARLIQEFKAGLLPLTDGTTLRTFLSKLLNCDPMRISKKFVGSNCIGKQVFRRRTADLNRLTPEQIQQSRNELSELERRFLERVAQTNRVKNTATNSQPVVATPKYEPLTSAQQTASDVNNAWTNPGWLQPPRSYKHGTGLHFAQTHLSSNARAAAAGRALLGATSPANSKQSLLEELQRRSSVNSASNLLAQAVRNGSSAALQQLARNASGT